MIDGIAIRRNTRPRKRPGKPIYNRPRPELWRPAERIPSFDRQALRERVERLLRESRDERQRQLAEARAVLAA
jgi:hypothetical protein